MELFRKHGSPATPASTHGTNEQASSSGPVKTVQAAANGHTRLTKNTKVTLTKGTHPIVASNGWEARGKDYDLKALVRYRDGRLIYVGAANRDEVLSTPEGAIVHGGDVKKGSGALETVTMKWDPHIASVALSSYSAIENGPGSFHEYGVFVNIVNGGQVIGINAADASANRSSYTCCFGEVIFELDGRFTVINHEMYSESGSENRVGYNGDLVVMDIGPRGQTK